jgi:D-serine deaminase-like pyridoxal phosphate-dependent protein
VSPVQDLVGATLKDIDTPALLLDATAMKRNVQRMAEFAASKRINLRPHAKIYKATPQLARLQMAAGAIGITCAKLSEAETLASAGIQDILIANQIVGRLKMERLVDLARSSRVLVAVDSFENVAEIDHASQTAGVSVGVLIEVNIGHNRCGVAPFEAVVDLARFILGKPGLAFRGLMGYDGHNTLKVSEAERGGLSLMAYQLLSDTRKYLEAAGIKVEIVSGGGTFTYQYAAEVEGITELQTGTYLLMDTAFQEHGVREFECSLSVLTSVVSTPVYPGAKELVIVDTGRKSVSTVLGLPEVKDPPGARVISLSDEHGRVIFSDPAAALRVGDRIELWVRDANGTINQFDRFYVIRDGLVEAVWKIPLLGCAT